jgi:hypothetical protein
VSAGVMCLRCRAYISTEAQPVAYRHACHCADPVPSLDARTEIDLETETRLGVRRLMNRGRR